MIQNINADDEDDRGGLQKRPKFWSSETVNLHRRCFLPVVSCFREGAPDDFVIVVYKDPICGGSPFLSAS